MKQGQTTKAALTAVLLALAGCAAEPPNPMAQPNCVSYRGERCVAWVFGPTNAQRARFGRNQSK